MPSSTEKRVSHYHLSPISDCPCSPLARRLPEKVKHSSKQGAEEQEPVHDGSMLAPCHPRAIHDRSDLLRGSVKSHSLGSLGPIPDPLELFLLPPFDLLGNVVDPGLDLGSLAIGLLLIPPDLLQLQIQFRLLLANRLSRRLPDHPLLRPA